MPSDPVPPVLDPPDLVLARKREAALRDVLDIIRTSRGDPAPVFDATLRRAAELCGATAAVLIFAKPGDATQRLVAHYGADPVSVGMYDRGEVAMDPKQSYVAQAIHSGQAIHVADLKDTDRYRAGARAIVSAVDDSGVRTILFIPLRANEGTIGVLTVDRNTVCPFSDDEIALVETFATQAVIALENARQFRELQTRFEREKASASILEVISQSRDDERPVFAVILRSAARLCNAPIAGLMLLNATGTHLVMAAKYGEPQRAHAEGDSWPMDPLPGPVARSIRAASIVHMHDLAQTEEYRNGHPTYVRLVDEDGLRTDLSVPLLRDGVGFGAITLSRRVVDPFDEADIALVETFAAQAAIAIENVRQFRELQTRLAREAATREILEVISQSRDDDRPVFDAVLRNSALLCGASMASLDIVSEDLSHAVLVAHWGENTADLIPVGTTVWRMDSELAPPTCMREGRVVHIHDMVDTDLYRAREPARVAAVEMEGIRTFLAVPLISGGLSIGCIEAYRREVRPFTPDEIALLETFAAQAVIAIENVRQFKALEALNAELGDRVQDQVGEIERMGRLKRFLPAAVADAVVSSGSEKMLKSHRALLGVLFCDIRGFTAFCETAEPEETIEVLQTYHDEMGRLIEAHGAGVDHRMGDGIMVLFNDPLPCDDPAGAAVRLGVAMRARMAELCARWKKMGYRLGFGVGISLGYATVGMVGSGGRFDYTASGTAVNLAARLCDEAADGEILISQRAATAVEDYWVVEPRGARTVKGIREPVAVFCVMDPV